MSGDTKVYQITDRNTGKIIPYLLTESTDRRKRSVCTGDGNNMSEKEVALVQKRRQHSSQLPYGYRSW
jgi:hypothetical protein